VWYSDRSRSGKNDFSESFAGPRPAEAPRVSGNKTVRFHFFFDTASAELFADDGANVMTEIFFPQEPFSKVKVYAGKGKVKLIGGEGFALRGIW
jgi:fructan beta-fructosidase